MPDNSSPPPRPPLSDILLDSAQCVRAVSSGRSLSDALAEVARESRPAVQAVAFHVMRRLGLARAVRGILVRRTPPDALADALLLVALAVLDTALDHAQPDPDAIPARRDLPVYAVHTVVDQAVRAATAHRATRPYKALVNASLRRFAREQRSILAQAAQSDEARWNYPEWWLRLVREAYPDNWRALLEAGDRPGPMTLRVNTRRSSVGDLLPRLRDAGLEARALDGRAVTLDTARPVRAVPGFDEGWWSVQDISAQRAAALLAPVAGERVLDACAAPGGKTAHLLELADVRLLALDDDATRLARIRENLDRLGLMSDAVSLRCADAADVDAWWDGTPFDAVLADVPCTASGIVRRHPDIRWLRQSQDVVATARLQERIVDALWRVVGPGGRLVYATCSVFPQEGVRQAARFRKRHPDATSLPAPGQLLPIGSPDVGDGFFYAAFAKRTPDGQK
ncbi:MAG TPA: 16S rRNA (cytosine(967)-C(5))-methyltransferase RsmB [Burkholderiaceae bacterium]|nr:16S rRNA (cytosine(967)-C(5))-methyltransferase RsmB [Burkholderiaceae bacterium]